jgi:arylsulfatase
MRSGGFSRHGGRAHETAAAAAVIGLAAGLLACQAAGPGAAASRGPAGGGAPAPRPRNIVLLTCDTLRADRVGAYGSTTTRTPAIDALAARGALFERAYATFPKTNPALSSVLTGRYPSAHGVRRNGAHLPESELTLAEILQAAGYETAAFVSNHVMPAHHGLAQGFRLYDDHLPDPVPTRPARERTARTLVNAALEWAGRRPPGPAFLWVHFIDPHGPYTAPGYEAFAAAAAASGRDGGRTLPVSPTDAGVNVIPAYQALPGVTGVDVYVSLYDREVEHMDAQLGRLLDGLAAEGLLDGALVVFTADHGESLGDHGLYFQHGSSLHDPQLRVPLIVAGPGVAPRRIEAPASGVDLMPTILDLAGLPPIRGVQGESLAPLLGGGRRGGAEDPGSPPDPGPPRVLLAELGRTYMALQGTRKLVWDAESKAARLYDLAADPGETRDAGGEHPAAKEALLETAARFARENTRDVAPATDEETIRVLRSLGYVE